MQRAPERLSMNITPLRAGTVLAAAAILIASNSSPAQCAVGWSEALAFPGLSGYAYKLGVYDDGSGARLFAGGASRYTPGRRRSRNGTAWRRSGLPMMAGYSPDSRVHRFRRRERARALRGFPGCRHPDGGMTLGCIGRWDGTSWSTLGPGLNGAVRALAVFDDGSGPALYAGGEFDASGSTSLNRVARWNGVEWCEPWGEGSPGTPGFDP